MPTSQAGANQGSIPHKGKHRKYEAYGVTEFLAAPSQSHPQPVPILCVPT